MTGTGGRSPKKAGDRGRERQAPGARIADAARNSLDGLRAIWKAEAAFRLEVLLLPPALIVLPWITDSPFRAALLIGVLLLLLLVEILNTAIERTIDRIGPERHELSRMAKDLGSLAVAVAAVIAATAWAGAAWEAVRAGG